MIDAHKLMASNQGTSGIESQQCDKGFMNRTDLQIKQRQHAQDPFDSVEHCRYYDLDTRSALLVSRGQLIDLLHPYCKPQATILELGCATGLTSLQIAGTFPDVKCYGVEENSNLLAVLRENIELCNITNYKGNFEYEQGKLTELPICDKSVDVVFAFLIGYRVDDVKPVLSEMERVKKTDGVAFLFDLARDADAEAINFIYHYINVGSFKFLNADQFLNLLSRSYSSDEITKLLNASGLNGWNAKSDGVNLIVSSQAL